MADDIRLYSAQGEGIIDSGYSPTASELLQVIGGSVAVTVGTEVEEVSAGDFIFIPANQVFRVETICGPASVRGLSFEREIVESNMDNFDGEINYMFYVQSFSRVVTFKPSHPIYESLCYCMGEAYEEYISKDVCFRLPVRAYIYLLNSSILRYYAGARNEMDRVIYHNVIRLRPVVANISLSLDILKRPE